MRTVLASLFCLPLVACVADDESQTENLGTTESNLCTDGAADAVVAFQNANGFSGATSPGPTSNYDRAACADRYTVEVTGVSAASQPFEITGGWGEALPVTEDVCTLALANVQAQEYTLTGFNCAGQFCIPTYGWKNVGSEVLLQGQWQAGFGNSHTCNLVPASPLPTLQPSAFRSKVRVSVRAYAWALFFPAFKKGQAGVWSDYIIH
jgi:hypothetical protein